MVTLASNHNQLSTAAIFLLQMAAVVCFNGLIASKIHIGTEVLLTCLAVLYVFRRRLPAFFKLELIPYVLLLWFGLCIILNF